MSRERVLDKGGRRAPWLARWRMPALSRPGRHLLVVDVGPAGCEASLWRSSGRQAEEGVPAEPLWRASVGDLAPEQALAPLLRLLRGSGQPMPRQVALVTASALLAQVDLPVDPRQPRPPLQMLEMARYEAEPAAATHDAIWSVGEVLVAREALEPAVADAIQQALDQAVRNDRGDLLEFDEDCLARSGLDRAALDRALEAQQELQIHHRELACGWHGGTVRDAQGHRGSHWRVAAMAQAARARWREALKAQRLRLKGIWPRTGLAALDGAVAVGTTLVLELSSEQSTALRLVDGRVAGLRSEPRNGLPIEPALMLELLAEWLSEPVAEIVLVVSDPQAMAADLVAPLQRMSRTPVRVLAASAAQALLARARTVVAELALPGDKRRALDIGLRDPRPPVWKQPAWRPWLALAALAAALLVWQGWTWWQILDMRRETQRMADEQKQQSAGSQSEAQLSAEAQRLDQEANHLRQELAMLLARTEGMRQIEQRREDIPALIRTLGEVIDGRVVLDALIENDQVGRRQGLEVRAWSPRLESLQDYSARVAQAVAPLDFAVAQGEVVGKPGRFRTPGYQIRFWLVPGVAELGEDAQPEPPARRAVPDQDALDVNEKLVTDAPASGGRR